MAQGEKIIPINIEEQMKSSYIDYSMSVIVSRALPDVRDGLKPVHRRVLYGMHDMGVTSTKAYKKSARVVGDVLGNTTRMAIAQCMIPWCVWHRIGHCDTCSLMAKVTLVVSMEIVRLRCDTLRCVCARSQRICSPILIRTLLIGNSTLMTH